MKKLVAILLAVMLMLGVSGCSMVGEIFEESDDIMEDVLDGIDDVFDDLEDMLR